MKYYYTLLLSLAGLLISSYSVAQGSLEALDKKNGFRDVKFGASIRNYPGMTLDEGNYPLSTTKTYIRKTDKLLIGDVKIDPITYRFFKGRLCDVDFTFRGKEEANELLKAFELLYGPHMIENNHIKWETEKILVWFLPKTIPDGDTFTQVVFISKEMFDLMGKYQDAENATKAKRLEIEKQIKLKKRASDL